MTTGTATFLLRFLCGWPATGPHTVLVADLRRHTQALTEEAVGTEDVGLGPGRVPRAVTAHHEFLAHETPPLLKSQPMPMWKATESRVKTTLSLHLASRLGAVRYPPSIAPPGAGLKLPPDADQPSCGTRSQRTL